MFNLRIKPSLALASFALAGASLVAAGGQALAADATVNFSGSVGQGCTLSNPVAGNLAVNAQSPSYLSTDDGTDGTIQVNCTGAARLEVSEVGMTNMPPGANLDLTRFPYGLIFSSAGVADRRGPVTGRIITTPGAINETLSIKMILASPVAFPSGRYEGYIKITANPL
jgi:hypothetical protein